MEFIYLLNQACSALNQLLHKIPKFHLISCCGNFVERHSFHRVWGDSPETLRNLCLSTKFLHQEIRLNFSVFYAVEIQIFIIKAAKIRKDIFYRKYPFTFAENFIYIAKNFFDHIVFS